MAKLFGSIEAGGTKFVCAVANEKFEIIKKIQFATGKPKDTLGQAIDFFKSFPDLLAIGIGSFGPIDIKKSSKTYGYVTSTPKEYWSNVDFLGTLRKELPIPMSWTTDVNASAYGEYMFAQGEKVDSLLYFTIGTGIGGGALQKGEFIGGFTHAEMGHMMVRQHAEDLDFEGVCPYHKNACLEGLASGPTIFERTNEHGENLPRTHKVFELIAYYAAQAAYNAYVSLASERIIFGGSVLSEADMPRVRAYFEEINAGYVQTPNLEELIQVSKIADNGSATLGNFALAMREYKLTKG